MPLASMRFSHFSYSSHMFLQFTWHFLSMMGLVSCRAKRRAYEAGEVRAAREGGGRLRSEQRAEAGRYLWAGHERSAPQAQPPLPRRRRHTWVPPVQAGRRQPAAGRRAWQADLAGRRPWPLGCCAAAHLVLRLLSRISRHVSHRRHCLAWGRMVEARLHGRLLIHRVDFVLADPGHVRALVPRGLVVRHLLVESTCPKTCRDTGWGRQRPGSWYFFCVRSLCYCDGCEGPSIAVLRSVLVV